MRKLKSSKRMKRFELRPSPWQGDALPLSYIRKLKVGPQASRQEYHAPPSCPGSSLRGEKRLGVAVARSRATSQGTYSRL